MKNNLDEIMEVEGIDVLFLGPYDISQSLGIPGQVRNKKVADAIGNSQGATVRVEGAGFNGRAPR